MKRFAWIPKKVSSGKIVWLSYYYHYETPYDFSTGRPPLFAQYFTFTETPKEKTFRLLKESIKHNRNVWNDPRLAKEDQC
jgi:hypothetical protein